MGQFRSVALLALGLTTAAAVSSGPAAAAPVAVRYAETITHAFLAIHSADGDLLAHGELVQAPIAKRRWDSRLVFRFKDGSLWDERGPAFPEAMEVTFDRDTGHYRTATRYLVKMDLKGLTGVVVTLIRKDPPDLRSEAKGAARSIKALSRIYTVAPT